MSNRSMPEDTTTAIVVQCNDYAHEILRHFVEEYYLRRRGPDDGPTRYAQEVRHAGGRSDSPPDLQVLLSLIKGQWHFFAQAFRDHDAARHESDMARNLVFTASHWARNAEAHRAGMLSWEDAFGAVLTMQRLLRAFTDDGASGVAPFMERLHNLHPHFYPDSLPFVPVLDAHDLARDVGIGDNGRGETPRRAEVDPIADQSMRDGQGSPPDTLREEEMLVSIPPLPVAYVSRHDYLATLTPLSPERYARVAPGHTIYFSALLPQPIPRDWPASSAPDATSAITEIVAPGYNFVTTPVDHDRLLPGPLAFIPRSTILFSETAVLFCGEPSLDVYTIPHAAIGAARLVERHVRSGEESSRTLRWLYLSMYGHQFHIPVHRFAMPGSPFFGFVRYVIRHDALPA